MKKLKILLSLFLLSIIISCSTENEQPVEDYNFQLSEKLMVKESTENISDLLFNMGVSKINVEYSDNRFLFKNETQKSFILNGKTLDLEDYDFILEKLNIFLTNFNFNDFIWIGVFILGILTWILTFSRFVKYLLNKHKNKTIVSLSGLIIGSLPILIPFEITELNTDYVISNSTIFICFGLGIFLLIGINFMSKNEK